MELLLEWLVEQLVVLLLVPSVGQQGWAWVGMSLQVAVPLLVVWV